MTPDVAVRRPVVVVAIKGLGIGGAEKLVSEGARFWDRQAFDYRVAYALPWKDQLVAELEALSVPVRCIGSKRGVTPSVVPRFRRLLSEWRADLVHAHLPVAGIIARLAGNVPVVYTEHNLAWSYRPWTRAVNRLTYGRNTAVTAVSQAVADTISGYPGPTAEVIPNGVSVSADPQARSVVRSELGLEEDDQLVVHVGNIRPGKGHEVLIDAAALLRDKGARAVVVSIGVEKNPGDLRRLRAKTIGPRTRWIGSVSGPTTRRPVIHRRSRRLCESGRDRRTPRHHPRGDGPRKTRGRNRRRRHPNRGPRRNHRRND